MAVVLACAVWVIGQVVPAALAGRLIPDPVATLTRADVEQAGAYLSQSQPPAVPALAPAAEETPSYLVRIDLASGADAPRAVLLRNGSPAATFRRGTASVDVSPGDLLEIDSTAYRQPLTFVVVQAAGLASPAVGEKIVVAGAIAPVGRVRPEPATPSPAPSPPPG